MHAHWQLKQHALLCLRFCGGAPQHLGGPPLGASMGFPHRGVRAGWAAWTNSLLDLLQPLGANLGRWLDSPVLPHLLPQVGAIPSGIGWRMRRGIGGMHSVSLLARHPATPIYLKSKGSYSMSQQIGSISKKDKCK